MAKKPKPKSRRVGAYEREANKEGHEEIPVAVELAEEVEKLSGVEQMDMAGWLSDRVKAAMNSKEHVEAIERIDRFREAYLNGVQRTNTGMSGASDYRSHLAAAQADSMTSRLISVFSTSPIVKLEGGNELGRQNARFAEQFLGYHHDFNINLPMHGAAICPFMSIEGHAVLYAPPKYEIDDKSEEIVRVQIYHDGKGGTLKVDPSDAAEIKKAVDGGWTAKDPIEYSAECRVKPKVVKYWPDLSVRSRKDYLIPRGTKPYPLMERPPWEGIKEYFTWGQLKEMEKEGKIYSGSLKKISEFLKKNLPPIQGDEEDTVNNTGEDRKGLVDDLPFEKDSLDAVLQCWVIYGFQYHPKEKKMFEMISIYHHQSSTLLSTKQNKLIGKPRGIFHLRLTMTPIRFEGIGVMELCYMGEKAVNDLTCFVLDEGRIFSCLPFWYNKKRFPNGVNQFEFWKGVGLLNKEKDFGVLQFNDRRPMDMNIATALRAHMERRSGQGDLQLGRESDVTGKQPPTARGTMSIIREGMVRFTLLNFCLVGEIVRFSQYEMSIFQQLLGDSTVPVEILGEDGKQVFPAGLSRVQILGSFLYKANHAAQNMIRELDAEINFTLYGMMKDNKLIGAGLEPFYNMTRDVLLSAGKKDPLWLKPLSFYEELSGKPSGSMNAAEQKFAETLLAKGVPMERIKMLIDQMRGGGRPAQQQQPEEPNAEAQAAEQALILGEGGEE